MNERKGLRRFFARGVHNREGFTLVELIVVIAILGILGGVAVPVYKGYVEKADRAADDALLNEVNTALVSAFMANGENNVGADVPTQRLTDGILNYDGPHSETFNLLYEGDSKFKVYTSLGYNEILGMFEGFVRGVSTFKNSAVLEKIGDTFNVIGGLLYTYGVGDPEEIEEILKHNLGANVSTTLGLDEMLDGYLLATQLEGDDLKAMLEKYCPEYAALTTDTDKELWITNNAEKIKQLKANLGVMHFANSANTGDSEQLLGNVMSSLDSIVDAAVNFETPDEADIWAYYITTPRGQEALKAYNGDATAAHNALLTDANSDYNRFMNTKDDMLGLYGAELAALSNAIGTGTENQAGINTLGSLYALSAGYFNSEYFEGDGSNVTIGTFPTVVAALMDPGFKEYYDTLGEADIAEYLEQMRNLSGSENLDLTSSTVFTGVFTGGSN